MIKLIFYFLLAYMIYQVIRFFQSLGRRSPRPQNPRPRLSGMMVKDQICNTYLPKEEALREVFDGKEYFFCSKECRQKFLETREN